MDSFEFNKIAGAVLGTALFVMALSIISEMIYEPVEPAKPGYVVAIAAPEPAHGAAAAAAAAPIAARLQAASATAGADVAKKCVACHTLLKGEPAKVGPNLFGIVGDHAAHQPGFSYSMAMVARRDQGFAWSYDNLDAFLAAPKQFIPDTAMGFAGLPKPADRADVIAYLRELSDMPIPLPPPPAPVAAAASGAPPAQVAAVAPGAPPAPGVQAGNAANGEVVAKRCVACHTLMKDQPARIGPNLWGIVGASAAHQGDYAYSEAMLAEKAKGLKWTSDKLDQFLTAPKTFVPETKMSFAGLPMPEDRADVIAYLRTLADKP
jgi:cytochrome c